MLQFNNNTVLIDGASSVRGIPHTYGVYPVYLFAIY